jgi:putative membrane protein
VGASELVWARDRRDGSGTPRVSITNVLTAASFALLLDVTIEPFAVNINRYWVWGEASGSTYYGIPMSNFVAWWVTSLLLSWVLLWQRSRAARAVRYGPIGSDRAAFWPWLPLTLYLSNLTMFVVVNLARGQVSAAVIGAAIMLFLAAAWLLPRMVRRLRQASEEAGV